MAKQWNPNDPEDRKELAKLFKGTPNNPYIDALPSADVSLKDLAKAALSSIIRRNTATSPKVPDPAAERFKVAFPFESLTELAEDCAQKFVQTPLLLVPVILVSPDHYFDGANAVYRNPVPSNTGFNSGSPAHEKPPIIYFNDSFVKDASPAELADEMMRQLVHAWLHQHIYCLTPYPEGDASSEPSYVSSYMVALKMMGIEDDGR